jgi:hypothetical protein
MRGASALALVGCLGAVAVAVAVAAAFGATATPYATSPTAPGPINPKAIPLGDGYVSTTPKIGYVDSCITSFGGIGGAEVDGPWIDAAAKSWNETTKLAVNGAVKWPQAYFKVTVTGSTRVISFDDLPIDHTTGVFPIAGSDPAYAYDHNGNHIASQAVSWKLPLNPTPAHSPGCTSGGPIGVLDDGVYLFNALDGEGRDAAAHELLDACAGHPDPSESYHHHDVPSCILDKAPDGAATLVGYALDGYGIYVVRSVVGTLPTNTQLDACHGTTSVVPWNERPTRIYHYVATLEYPYTVGCYHGTPIAGRHGPGAGPATGAGQP